MQEQIIKKKISFRSVFPRDTYYHFPEEYLAKMKSF